MSKTIKCGDTDPRGSLTCDHTVTAETADEAVEQFGKHASEAHADMMAQATEEDKANWVKNFKENVWPNTPDDEPAAA